MVTLEREGKITKGAPPCQNESMSIWNILNLWTHKLSPKSKVFKHMIYLIYRAVKNIFFHVNNIYFILLKYYTYIIIGLNIREIQTFYLKRYTNIETKWSNI